MSRHPVKEAKRENLAEQYAHFISEKAVPTSMTLQEVHEESQRDPTIQFVMRAIETNNWKALSDHIDTKEIAQYHKVRTQLTARHDETTLKNSKIIIPKTLCNKAINLAHISHQGIANSSSDGNDLVPWD